MPSWGKFWTQKIQRNQKTQLPLLKCREQKQGTVHAPCTQHHLRGGKIPKPPLWPATPLARLLYTPLPSPHIRPKPPLWPDSWTHPYPHPI